MRATKTTASNESTSLDAPPLDFANMNIKNLTDLKYIQPKQGKRKPVVHQEIEENKDEKKKNDQTPEANLQSNQNLPQNSQQEEDQNNEGEEEEKEKERLKEKDLAQKQRGIPSILRTISPNQPSFVMSQSIALNSALKGATKMTDEVVKKDHDKSFKVRLIQSSLVLSYNKIRHINNFHSIIDLVMIDCKNLQWIDLSHNYLETLDYNFADFPILKSLYLHGNYLKDIKDLEQLSHLEQFRNLTIHGNPLDTIQNFRLYIIGILPRLIKLDSVLISKKELDNTFVWKNNFRMITPPLPKLEVRPKNIQGNS